MLRCAFLVREDSDFFEAGLDVGARASLVAQKRERLPEGVYGLHARRAGRPVFQGCVRAGPPPILGIVRGPGDAVVTLALRTGDLIRPASQAGENGGQRIYHEYPLSFAQFSHACAIFGMLPAASFGTGWAPVIRLRA